VWIDEGSLLCKHFRKETHIYIGTPGSFDTLGGGGPTRRTYNPKRNQLNSTRILPLTLPRIVVWMPSVKERIASLYAYACRVPRAWYTLVYTYTRPQSTFLGLVLNSDQITCDPRPRSLGRGSGKDENRKKAPTRLCARVISVSVWAWWDTAAATSRHSFAVPPRRSATRHALYACNAVINNEQKTKKKMYLYNII